MRKAFFKVGVVLLAVTMLSACAGQTPSATSISSSSSPSPAATQADSATPTPLAGTATAQSGASSGPTSVVVRVPTDPDHLDPHLSAASLTQQMMLNVFEGLVRPTPDGGIEPAVAQSYSVSNDGLTYTFILRRGIKFHNGDLVTVDDLRYTFERLMGKDTGKPLTSNLDAVASLETPDASTFVVHLKKVNSSFLALLPTLSILPRSNDGHHDQHPIGTGPYKFVEYLPQQRLVLEKFTDYWQPGVPVIDRVEFRIIPDDQAALLALQSGQVQLTGISADQAASLGSKFKIVSHGANSVLLMAMNEQRKPFDDIRVRQAIEYAVDKDAIITAVFNGYATKLGSNMSPVMAKYYADGLTNVYPVDIAKAKSLLSAAGYPNGFETTVSVSSHAPMYAQAAQIVAQQLAQIGIRLKIETVEWGVWLDRIYTNRDYDMTIIDFTGKLDPYAVLGRYTSDYPRNFFNYKNPAYDTLMQQALGQTDEAKRVELYKQAQQILTQDAVAVYICDYQFVWAMDPKLQGYTPYPIFFHDMARLSYAQ